MDRTIAELDWPVRTERLDIRPAAAEDAAALFAYRSDEESARWVTRHISDPVVWHEWFARPEVLATTLVMERHGEVLGDLTLKVQDGWAQTEVADQGRAVEAEIGWVLAAPYRGSGYAREGVEALLGICFDGLGLRRVVAGCFADNEASWRLMERLGMRREGRAIRDSLHRELGWLDGMTYALLAEEWRERS